VSQTHSRIWDISIVKYNSKTMRAHVLLYIVHAPSQSTLTSLCLDRFYSNCTSLLGIEVCIHFEDFNVCHQRNNGFYLMKFSLSITDFFLLVLFVWFFFIIVCLFFDVFCLIFLREGVCVWKGKGAFTSLLWLIVITLKRILGM
jgi:hypothetical protein